MKRVLRIAGLALLGAFGNIHLRISVAEITPPQNSYLQN